MRIFMLRCVPSLKFVSLPVRKIWRTSGLSISRPGDLDVWPLTLNLGRITGRGVDNLPTNFGLPMTFRSRLNGQHLSDTSRDLATLTFDLEGHGACRWCGSSCCVCLPSLKFVGLPVRKILDFFCSPIMSMHATDGQTDGRTDRQPRPIDNAPPLRGRGHNNMKLNKSHAGSVRHSHFFTHRVMNVWNSLPNTLSYHQHCDKF